MISIEIVTLFSDCGDNILLENVSTSLIIMTPFSGKWRPAYAKCKWRILPSKFPEARVRIVDLQLPSMNSSTCSSVLLIIGNNKISCGHLLKRDYVIPTDNSEISFQISDNTYPVGVIISIETVGKYFVAFLIIHWCYLLHFIPSPTCLGDLIKH